MNKELLRIPGADGLRAIACLLVVWHHISQRFNPETSAAWIKGIHFLGMRGEVGVSLFFVLSGCLLSLPFWNSFVTKSPLPSLRFYAINRAARIIPAYWVNLLLCTFLAFWVFNIDIDWWRLISGLLFINSYHYSTFFPAELNGPLWSIGLEVSCYLLLPLVLFAVIKSTKKISFAIAGMAIWILGLQLVNPWIISNFMTSDKLKGWEYGFSGGAKQWLPYWNIGSFFTQFLCGSLAALVITALRVRNISKSRFFDYSTALLALVALLLVANRLTPGAPDSLTKQPYIAPFYSLIMAGVIISASFSTQMYKILDNKLFRWFANLSFSIYLWHMVIITMFERKLSINYVYYGLSNPAPWVFISAIVLLGSIVIASLSWRFLESPILKSARKFTENRS